MARAPLDWPGSWLPVQHLQVGDVVIREVWGRQVGLTPAPVDYADDPWPDSKDPRVAVPWYVVSPPPQ